MAKARYTWTPDFVLLSLSSSVVQQSVPESDQQWNGPQLWKAAASDAHAPANVLGGPLSPLAMAVLHVSFLDAPTCRHLQASMTMTSAG